MFGKKINHELLLIELKRPSITINRDTERQAQEYRDELNVYFPNQKIEIILMGGKVKQNINSQNTNESIKYLSYIDVIGSARSRLEWMLEELKRDIS